MRAHTGESEVTSLCPAAYVLKKWVSSRSKGSGYSSLSPHPDHDRHNSDSSGSFLRINSEDLEMAESRSPPNTSLTVWDGNSRDKARQIFLGGGIVKSTSTSTSASNSSSAQLSTRRQYQSQNQSQGQRLPPSTQSLNNPLHRRQLSNNSNATVVNSFADPPKRPVYHHRSGSSLQNFGAGPGRRGSPTPGVNGTGTGLGVRRPLFRIGTSGEEDDSGVTSTDDSD
ncbi:hypothetical protein FRB94_004706 [Tulasnella sp. JGI-2019a]|nr:hypothetical protein FRB94_004706 [Tulasnella sp. JGI-2019a]